jgi:sugar/nucleoside kinase (ribokinase family)
MAESAQSFDLITIDRIGVDLYPSRPGIPLARTATFQATSGRSAARVAVAAARLGRTSVVVHADAPDYFAIRAARLFWVTGTGLSEEPSRSATLAALKARGRAGTTVFDLDWRPAQWADSAWKDPAEARPCYAEVLRHATVAVGDLDACEMATGSREPRACAEALLAAGVELALVRQGSRGVLAVHRDGTTAEVRTAPPEKAGGPDTDTDTDDVFGGSLCHGLLSGWELDRTLRYATAAGRPASGADPR